MEALTPILFELALVTIAGAIGFVYRHFNSRDKTRQEEIEGVEGRVDELENSHLSLKQRMYGLGTDESDLGHIVETNQRLNRLSDEITETREQMRSEHRETKMLLLSIVKTLEQADDIDFDAPNDDSDLVPDGGVSEDDD